MAIRPISGLAAFAALMAAGPSTAQYYYGPAPGPYSYNVPPPGWYAPPPPPYYGGPDYRPAPRPLSPDAVVDRLEDLGFDDVGRPRFTGTLYIVVATAPGGSRQQITVDAIRGVILNRQVIGRAPTPDDDDDDDAPRRRTRVPPRELDTSPRRPQAPRQREAARPPVDTAPSVDREPPAESVPAPAPVESIPLQPPTAPESRVDVPTAPPRPFEGRAGNRDARVDAKPELRPSEAGPRPFGVNPGQPTGPARKKPDEQVRQPTSPPDRKGGLPPKATAEARPPQPGKPVRVIPGVTPMTGGGSGGASTSQLDSLPTPPAPPAPSIAQ